MFSRREFLHYAAGGAMTFALPGDLYAKDRGSEKPNIILCMAGDLGWADVGFNGNKIIKTPCTTDVAASTLDYFPTVLEALGFTIKGKPEPSDGTSLIGLIEGKVADLERIEIVHQEDELICR